MAENKAQRQLESLLNMQGEAQDAQANLAKLNEARDDFFARSDGEARFALPEALATGIAASWVLGPGGLLLGLAQGLLGKKEEQNIIDAFAQDSAALQSTNDIFNDELDRLSLTTTSPNDLEQLSAMQTQKDAAMQLMMSANPELQAKGQDMMTEFATGLNQYTVRQEEQDIAATALDDQLRRELEKETYDRHRALLGDFQQESGNFEAQQATANNIMQSLNKGDGASVTAALATLPLLVNPDAGATTEAEVEIWQKVGGTVDSLIGRVQKELGSGGLTDDTRQEIIDVAQQYKRNSISFQQAREAFYGNIISTEGIPQKLWSQYNLSGRLPVVQNGGFVRGEALQENNSDSAVNTAVDTSTSLIDKASMAINDSIDSVKHELAWREEFFKIHGRQPRSTDNQGVGN